MANTVLHADIKIVGPLPSGSGQKILTVNPTTGEVGQIDSFISGITGDITIDGAGVSSITANVIVDADINASAAIAWSKMAAQAVSRVMVTNSSGVATTSFTTTVLNYVANLSSDAQTQINGKQDTIVGGASTVASANLAPNMALVAGATGKIEVHPTTTLTQIGYLTGVTSAIQTQLDARLTVSLTGVAEGDVIMYNGSAWVNLGRGTPGHVLTATPSTIQWAISGSAVVAGVTTQIQFNNAGILDADAGLVFDKTTGTLTATRVVGATSATLAGMNPGALAGNPSSLSAGDLWYNSTTANHTVRNTGTYSIAVTSTLVNNAVPYFTTGSTTAILNQSASFTYTSGTGVLAAGIFAPSSTSDAGIRVNAVVADPVSLSNGYVWYNSTSNELKARINGVTTVIGGGGGISGLTTNRIPYATSATTLGDDANLTFDSTNKRLIIGQGATYIGSIGAATTVNYFIGDSSTGNYTLSGTRNYGFGEGALNDLTTGSDNIAIGRFVGEAINSGHSNIGIGGDAIRALTGGVENVGVGVDALEGTTSGDGNIAIGRSALSTATGLGNYNIAIGRSAGNGLVTGAQGVYIGYNITPQSLSTNGQLSIQNAIFGSANTASTTTVSNGNLGLFATSWGTSAAKVIAVGTGTAPSTSPADSFQFYSADIVAGNAAPHFRTEVGDVIKVYAVGGWGTPSGSLTRTTFDSGTVTLPQLAERVAALLTDLKTNHGLLKA